MGKQGRHTTIKQHQGWRRLLLHPSFYTYLICSLLLLDSMLALFLHSIEWNRLGFMGMVQVAYPVLSIVFMGLLYVERLEKAILFLALFLLLLYPFLIKEVGFFDARISVHYVPIGFIILLGKQNKELSFEAFLGFMAILLTFFLIIVLHPEIDLNETSPAMQIQMFYSMIVSAFIVLIDYFWQKARSYYLTVEKSLTNRIGKVTSVFSQLNVNTDSLEQLIELCEEKIDLFFPNCSVHIDMVDTSQHNLHAEKGEKSLEKRAQTTEKTQVLDRKELKGDPHKIASLLVVPIIGKQMLLGTIRISNEQDFYFNESHIRLTEIISSLIGSRILEFENKALIYQSLEIELESQKLQELDDLKSHFVHNISKDIQTPLQLILGPSAKLIKRENDEPLQKMAGLIYSNANQLKDILDQLLQLGELDVTAHQLHVESIRIGQLFQLWSENFIHAASKKNIHFKLIGSPDLEVFGDRKKLTSIVHNLVNNAIKYTPKNGTVEVHYGIENDHFLLDVHDSGEGIPAKYHDKVFDRFFRLGEADGKGTGIGLSIVQEMTEIMEGSIKISTSHLGGTLFTFSYDQKHLEGLMSRPSPNSTANVSVSNTNHQPTLLIVEDHDDMRNFIVSCLSSAYNCFEAANGEEGIALAAKIIPDLIITDLMMPKKTGEDLCEAVRAMEKTQHIPIIVLSAKSSQRDKVKLYEMGADNYLTKPFESEELKAIVAVLIQSRNLTREKFRENFSRTAHLDAVFEHKEASFMEKVVQSIEKHLDDSDFAITTLCNELNMGRNQLQRKMKALTDLTPVEFVRFIRLKKAAQLLTEDQLSVSEVAYACGFNNLSYFSKVFKRMYKCLPSQYKADV